MIEVTGGIPLDDDCLEDVIGGSAKIKRFNKVKKIQYMDVNCQKCQKNIRVDIQQSKCECPLCGGINYFAG
ncbi:hypothetical protein [Butyrivibrio sp. AE3004]|uniref:hypothetical protein n=1 Tax=Butyrivibrio sp. AE3004 TaxID=1506994 RepID=UPI000494A282|nr:hypothetical protein [Butyrivibrio sp. AE3004]